MSLNLEVVELQFNSQHPEFFFLSALPPFEQDLEIRRDLGRNDGRALTCHTEATRRCHNSSKIPEEMNYQPKIQCLVKIFFRNEAEVKTFSDEIKLR